MGFADDPELDRDRHVPAEDLTVGLGPEPADARERPGEAATAPPEPSPLSLLPDEYCLVSHLAGKNGDRMQQDVAAARNLLSSALLGELARRVLDYENAITWNTSCTGCAKALDRGIEETFRRERAEGKLAALRVMCDSIAAEVPEGEPATVAVSRVLRIIGTEKEAGRG